MPATPPIGGLAAQKLDEFIGVGLHSNVSATVTLYALALTKSDREMQSNNP